MPGRGQNFKPETSFIHLFRYAVSLLLGLLAKIKCRYAVSLPKFKSYIKVKNIKQIISCFVCILKFLNYLNFKARDSLVISLQRWTVS